MKICKIRFITIFIFFFATAALPLSYGAGEPIPLDRISRVYGLTVAVSQPPSLLLAAQKGLYLAGPEGFAEPAPGPKGDFMGFAVHPADRKIIYLAGQTSQGGDIGFLSSSDGGASWRTIAKRVGGIGFHAITLGGAAPKVIYGANQSLNLSEDGGVSWRKLGKNPAGLIGMAASALQPRTIYAATQRGLFISRDRGKIWESAHPSTKPAAMVHSDGKGGLYAFLLGFGLVKIKEADLSWVLLSDKFDKQILSAMTIDPADEKRLYAATTTGAVVTSGDGGKSWISFEGSHNVTKKIIAKGRNFYDKLCMGCHGKKGRGQDPKTVGKTPPNNIAAPPLNDTAHAWHHTDKNLVNVILNGSSREGSPMIAWKSQLSREDAESIVAYIKSLWRFRSLSCQGARHMSCMRH